MSSLARQNSRANRRKVVNAALGLLLLGGVGSFIWPFAAGRSQMQRYCTSFPLGISSDEARQRTAKDGYRVSSVIDGRAFVYDNRSVARFNCVLKFANHKLVSASYEDNP